PQFEALEAELPVIRDDRKVSGYIRMEQKRGLIGIYEKENPNSVWHDHCPWDYENWLFDADYDRVMPYLEEALERMPIFADLGIQREVHGAISHPPDGNPLIGPAPGQRNYWCCCGTQIGIGWGPGLTRELARWMVHGAADISMRDYDPRRFGGYATKEWQVVKAHEDYCLRHEIPFPHFNRLAGRPVKPSPLHERLKAKGAVHEEVFGHERPRFFARGIPQKDHYSFRRTAVDAMIAQEVKAVRDCAGIMDITGFTKIRVSGPDAAASLDRLIANRLPRPGRVGLTHMLNEAGRIELETTIINMSDEAGAAFYLVCAAFFEQRLLDHLAKHGVEGVENLSSDWAALSLNGPRARDILSACTQVPLHNAAFPWMAARQIDVVGHRVWAFRMSYAGELGWELHMPRASALAVYDALWEAGKAHGLVDYGSFAMNAMRMEKGFKGAGELTNEVTLTEADVLRFARRDKDFLGAAKTFAEPKWLCAYLSIDPDGEIDGHCGEAVLMDGAVVGATSSVAYGPTIGKILAFAYLAPHAAKPGTELEVVIHGAPRAARVLSAPVYDPESLLPRADAIPIAAQ
ncbi:MAG: FAD-dependent oxidoreductase, partial [Pseudomonadota bacterium]